ncbi:MAG: hypothetical protein RBU37_00445 [Myxococcota bacterium]|jgi:hypothetical protein|nr:hypothetical protein [Myxococcota bacterium]
MSRLVFSKNRLLLTYLLLLLCLGLGVSACSDDEPKPTTDTEIVDSTDATDTDDNAETTDTPNDSELGDDIELTVNCDEKAAACAAEEDFGSAFTKSNGRADGTLVAIVRPTDLDCAWPNSSHITVQLAINGGVQRLVVSAEDISITSVSHPLIGPPYAEGWHEGQQLDYWMDLGVHSTDMTAASPDEVVDFVCSHLELGEEVSVFAYSDGSKPSSAHQIHRNDKYPDGAIVAQPNSDNPTWLLFRYADQSF